MLNQPSKLPKILENYSRVGGMIDIWTVANNEVKQKSEEELEKLEILYDTWVDGDRLMANTIMSSFD